MPYFNKKFKIQLNYLNVLTFSTLLTWYKRCLSLLNNSRKTSNNVLNSVDSDFDMPNFSGKNSQSQRSTETSKNKKSLDVESQSNIMFNKTENNLETLKTIENSKHKLKNSNSQFVFTNSNTQIPGLRESQGSKNKEKLVNTTSKLRTSRSISNNRQQVVSITYEEIGLFPRSFNRVFDRFFKQLFFDVENLVVQEYRFYRYLFLTTVKCLLILVVIPLVVNFCSKSYLIRPMTEYYWNSQQSEIFLNSYMQKRAFNELKDFEEKIYFESLVQPQKRLTSVSTKNKIDNLNGSPKTQKNQSQFETLGNLELKTSEIVYTKLIQPTPNLIENKNLFENLKTQRITLTKFEDQSTLVVMSDYSNNFSNKIFSSNLPIQNVEHSIIDEQIDLSNTSLDIEKYSMQFNEYIQQRLQTKTLELANHYNEESIEAITNFFADFMSFTTLWFLLLNLEIQINITKSFLLEVFFGLDDSKKSLLILFVTDLLVGYHSPNIWELFFSSLFDHYGLPENHTTIFLLVATLPVLLDVLFKYLIFRHLNRASPATVATYHAMIE